MKVGMIFECGPQGADLKVCKHLVYMLNPSIEISAVTLTNKRGMIADCGLAAAQLLADGCDRVIIVWDLCPPWSSVSPCRKEDRDAIMRSLSAAGAALTRVHLVCIEQELEAWLIADNRALVSFLSRSTRSARIPGVRKSDQISNPKRWLSKRFQENGRSQGYRDLEHAEKIIQHLPDCSRIKRCPSFARFALKVADIKL